MLGGKTCLTEWPFSSNGDLGWWNSSAEFVSMLCRNKVVLTIGGAVSIKLLWIEALKFSFFEIICLDKLFWFEYDIGSKESI